VIEHEVRVVPHPDTKRMTRSLVSRRQGACDSIGLIEDLQDKPDTPSLGIRRLGDLPITERRSRRRFKNSR